MRKRITTVILSMVLVAAMAIAIPAKVLASTSYVFYATVGSGNYGITIGADLLSTTKTRGSLNVDHISGPLLGVYDGYVESCAYDSNDTLLGLSRTTYEKYNVSSFSVTSTYIHTAGNIVRTQTFCQFLGNNFTYPVNGVIIWY